MNSAKTAICVLLLTLLAVCVSAIELEEFLNLVENNHPFFSKESLAVEVEEARRGTLLPPYDTRHTLQALKRVIGELRSKLFGE